MQAEVAGKNKKNAGFHIHKRSPLMSLIRERMMPVSYTHLMCGVADCSVGQMTKRLILPIVLLIAVAFFVGLCPGLFAWALPA